MKMESETPARFGGTPATRAMLRRMMRTRLAIVPAVPNAATPAQVISDFCEECGIDMEVEYVAELSARLDEDCVSYYADDGALNGAAINRILTAICDALDAQAGLIVEQRWLEKNKLRMLVGRFQRELEVTLGELGFA